MGRKEDLTLGRHLLAGEPLSMSLSQGVNKDAARQALVLELTRSPWLVSQASPAGKCESVLGAAQTTAVGTRRICSKVCQELFVFYHAVPLCLMILLSISPPLLSPCPDVMS